ncbi:MAG: hypothetical protein ACXVAK_00325 [Vulcanimicrobiaceae bacterium]
MSVSAAAIAAGLIGTVAAAPTAPKTAPTKAPSAKPSSSKASALSKFRQHQLDMMKVSAPGDEYFGRLKLSYLGINNTFHDETIRSGAYTTSQGIITQVGFADEALHAWSNKYPNDPQLARTYFLAIQAFSKIYTREAQNKAWQYMHIEVQKFPKTFFGKTVKASLAKGYTQHYFALPELCPTPEPTLPPGVKATPSPSSTETPSPTPSPTPPPAPGQPKVEIITPPCVPPATPAPAATLAPSPLPSGAPVPIPSGTPVPIPSGALTPTPAASPSPAATHHPRR